MAAQQVRLIALDPNNVSVLLALNAAAIYIGSAIGAFVGGFVITAHGLGVLGWVASAGAIAAALVLVLANQLNRKAKADA